jgi:hypothetical protein
MEVARTGEHQAGTGGRGCAQAFAQGLQSRGAAPQAQGWAKVAGGDLAAARSQGFFGQQRLVLERAIEVQEHRRQAITQSTHRRSTASRSFRARSISSVLISSEGASVMTFLW